MIDGSSWAYQLTLDCSACDNSQMTSNENITNFSNAVLVSLGMAAHGDIQIVNFDSIGRFSIQMVENNNKICLHTCDPAGSVYLEITSSKYFEEQDTENVVNLVREYFTPRHKIITTLLNRDGNLDMDYRTIRQYRWA